MADNPVPLQAQVDELATRVKAAESLIRSLLSVLEEVAGALNQHLGYAPSPEPRPHMPERLGRSLVDDEGLMAFPVGMAVASGDEAVGRPCAHAQGGIPPFIDVLAEAVRKAGPGGREYEGDAGCGFVEAGERLKGREG